MSELSLSQFRTELENERAQQGTRNYEWDEGGVLVPTPNNVPPPSAPTRRPGRPLPTGPSPFGIFSAIRDDACNARRLLGPSAFRNSTLPTAALSGASPSWRNTFDNVWDRFCGDSPGAHPGGQAPIVPFQGGQCPGARYTVQINLEVYQNAPGCAASPRSTPTVTVWGPIAGIDIGQIGQTPNLVRVFCRGLASQTILPNIVALSFGSFASTSGCPPARLTSINVQPVSGQPNNCGNPPPVYPPQGRTTLPQRTINIDVGGTPIQIQPTINFNLDEGAIQIDAGPELNVTFDGVNLNFNPGGGGGTPGNTPSRPSPDETDTDPEDPAPPPPTELDPNTDEPEEPEEVIRAVLVTVTEVDGFSTVIAGSGPDLDNYFPDLGTVKFRIRAANEVSGFTNPIRVQNIRAFIECPWDGGAFAVVGTPRPGVIWTLTPIFDVATIPQ